jgi:parallel beta-helix repeat protein
MSALCIPYDGMIIDADTSFVPGVYVLPKGISITADGITINGNGALLLGVGRQNRGVQLQGRRGVTIKQLRLQEFYYGLWAHNCSHLHIHDCTIGGTAELAANTDFLDIWLPAERAYGAAILLDHVRESRIERNDLQHQQNGVLAYSCHKVLLRANNASYCSGFGFHLFASSENLFERNSADFCCRYHQRTDGRGHLGADAAGFLIAHGSCRNIFRDNTARMGGDGFFLAGLTPQWQPVGCDDNLFERNDGSYSPNIAFEATFSRGNIYRENLANNCNYGFWLGFSRENIVERNQIRANRRAGVAVENGIDCVVRDNEFSQNSYGVLLWSKFVAPFAEAFPENDTSRGWRIEDNDFRENQIAIRIAADQDHGVRPLSADVPRCPQPRDHLLRKNLIVGSRIGVETAGCKAPQLVENRFAENIVDSRL